MINMLISILLIVYSFIEVYAQEPKIMISSIVRKSGEYSITLSIGKPEQSVYMRIDQLLSYSLTTPTWYDKSDSLTYTTINKVTLDLKGYPNTSAEELSDQLIFPSNGLKVKDYSFYLINSQFRNDYNLPRLGFAFGYKYLKDSFSLVHLLKQQGKIDHLSYGFYLPSKAKYKIVYGNIFFGGMPQKEIQGKQKGTCKVNPNEDHWACELSTVFINTQTNNNNTTHTLFNYSNTARVRFQIGTDMILAPNDFMSFLAETILKESIESKQCSMHNSSVHLYFGCSIGIIGLLPKINFRFRDFAITINLNDLWWIDEFYCELLIQGDLEHNNTWTLGSLFMMDKHLLFDYENNAITIYSDNDLIVYPSSDYIANPNKESNGHMILLYIIGCILGIIGCLIGIFIKVKVRDKR